MLTSSFSLMFNFNSFFRLKKSYSNFKFLKVSWKFNSNEKQFFSSYKMSGDCDQLLNLNTINPNVISMEYAVRGPLVIRAVALEKEIKSGVVKPFQRVIRANIGDCHAMGQKPITFIRQVLNCVTDPSLIKEINFPEDVKIKAKQLLASCAGGSIGSYSDSAGIEIIRRHCAEFIERRDKISSDWNNIVLTTGASEAIRAILTLINTGSQDKLPTGVMIPIPQYPLYTATLAVNAMFPIKYYLDEENQWALNIKELERALESAKDKCKPKALVVINPGNPTGSVLSKDNIKDIIQFAERHKLMIIADEVYQHNIYAEGAQFYSFKKIMSEMGIRLELASLMSASKGYMGECGLRGGYCEMFNFEPSVKAMFFKMLSARLCSSILGQIALDCVVDPPKPNDPSYVLHEKEKAQVLLSLKERAKLAADSFNSILNMKSNTVAGAMYAFPQLMFPPNLIKAAREQNVEPDFFYAMNLLEKTGICVIPGSGFGQKPGTYHFRTTILPQPDDLRNMLEKLKEFHLKFLAKYQ